MDSQYLVHIVSPVTYMYNYPSGENGHRNCFTINLHESDVAGLELMTAMDLQSGPLLTGQWTLTLANLSQQKQSKCKFSLITCDPDILG